MFFKRRTTYSFIITIFALASFLLILVSLFARHWCEAKVERDVDQIELEMDNFPLKAYFGTNGDDHNDPGAFLGKVYFGLFGGCKMLNYAFGTRPIICFSVYTEHRNVYNTGLLYAIIILLCIAVIFALVTTVFGLVNTLTLPIETIHGPIGLFIWNGLAILFSAIALIIYIILHFSQINKEVLNADDRKYFRTTDVSLGYAFWFIATAVGLLLANILFIILAYSSMSTDTVKKNKELYLKDSYDIGKTLSY